ncbi:MAG: hypothetical protein ACM3MH_08445 [Actinomycetota bacterium]
MTVPAYLPYVILTGNVLSLIAIFYGLNRALAEASWPRPERLKTVALTTAILIGWLAIAVGLSAAGFYHVTANGIPTIQYGLLLPIVIGVFLIFRSELASRILEAVPQPWIVGVQLYRALGVVFLILYVSGQLPGLFALPAGLGDVAIGLSAPLVGYAYSRMPRQAAGAIRVWNVLGILDLTVAVTMGFLTAPSAITPIAVHPSSELMTMLPMVMIPVYMVPLSVILHIASLVKLHREQPCAKSRKGMADAAA